MVARVTHQGRGIGVVATTSRFASHEPCLVPQTRAIQGASGWHRVIDLWPLSCLASCKTRQKILFYYYFILGTQVTRPAITEIFQLMIFLLL